MTIETNGYAQTPKNDNSGALTTKQLVNAIRKHELLEEYGLTNEEVKAVLKAYADVIFASCLLDIAVPFPMLGSFRPQKKKGFKGGKKMLPKKGELFRKGVEFEEWELEPKPDYSVITFRLSNPVRTQFREMTTVHDEVGDADEEVQL